MSRRKQTNPRAIKRDGKFFLFYFLSKYLFNCLFSIYSVSQDEDENSIPTSKSK
jgi:hypothetical protein